MGAHIQVGINFSSGQGKARGGGGGEKRGRGGKDAPDAEVLATSFGKESIETKTLTEHP